MKLKKRLQQVLSEPGKIGIQYTTKKGQIKKRYFVNPNAKVVKVITHDVFEDVTNKNKPEAKKTGRLNITKTLIFLKENNVDMKKKIKVTKAA